MDGAAPVEEDFSQLDVGDRLSHKSWKARVSGYEELIKQFKTTADEDDAVFKPYLSNPDILKKAALDSNAVAQEKAVECICNFVQWAGKSAGRTSETVMPAVVEKCLGSTRAGTKKNALELCLLYTEVEDSGDNVVNAVLDGLKAKQPKLVAGAVSVLKELTIQFGPKIVNPKPIVKQIPLIFAHADKTVRAEGTGLVQALYRYIGPAIDAHLSELKPVQIKELNESFADLDAKGEGKGTGVQTRFTRSQQREQMVKEAEGTLSGGAEEGGEADTEEPAAEEFELDLAEPVNVYSKIPAGFFEKVASSKWKERKEEALDPLLAVVSVPKIIDADFGELIRVLAGRMGDANIACVITAANCIEALAKGLKDNFAKHKSTVLAPMLEKLKEKKQNVLDALASALDAVFLSLKLEDITEEVATFSKHKNPSVKEQTQKWLVRCLSSTKNPPTPSDTKALSAASMSALEDSSEPVRAAAQEALGTLMKVIGERALNAQMDSLDDIKKAKVKEFFEKAQVKCKPGAAAAKKAAPTAATSKAEPPKPKAPVKKLIAADKENQSPSGRPASPAKPPVRAAPKGVAKAPAAPATKKAPMASAASSKSTAKPSASASEPPKYRFNQEEAEAQAESVLPAEVFSDLGNSNWKARLAAVEALQAWLEGGESESVEPELIIRCFAKKPGWKESNFQVFGKVFAIAQLLAEKSPSWSKGCAALIIPPASDKIGDIKLKKPAGDLLIGLAETSSLQFVLSQAYDPMSKQKAPKAQAEGYTWVEQALRDFGIAGLAVRDLIEFLKVGLKSSNAAVRTSATKTLITLKIFVGPNIKDFLQDLNPTLLTTIDSEFARVDGEAAPEPTRTSADLAAAATSSSGTAKGKKTADPADELFPRVDLDKLLPNGLVSSCNDANWKARKEAMEQLQGILEANKRLKPSLGGDLVAALKLRLADSNKVVQGLTLDIVARLAAGMNKPFERYARTLASPVAAVLADQKAGTRLAGTTTLSAMADACEMAPLIDSLATSLEAQNPALRKELLNWLEGRLAEPQKGLDLTSLAAPVLACIEDRNAEVRKSAQALLPVIVANAGFDFVMDQTHNLKPASRSTVIPIIEAARASAPAKASKATAPAPAATQPARTALSRPQSAAAKTLKSSAPASRSASPAEQDHLPASPKGPSRLGMKRPLASAAKAPVKSESPPSAADPPLRQSDAKHKSSRAAKEVGPLRWVIETSPRQDQIESLHQQMAPHVSSDLLSLLFSKDHHCERDFLAGLALLDDHVKNRGQAEDAYGLSWKEVTGRYIGNLDLVLKYLTIRFCDTSTTSVMKCLDLTEHLIELLVEESYFLADYEAISFLPSLVIKAGDQKDSIRMRVRAIFRSICSIYPASKVFTTIMDNGLKAKNARVRAESVDELGSLVQRQGMTVCQPNRALPVMATLISDRDPAVRSATLNAFASIYAAIGDALYKHIGSLSDKDRTFLDEKLKRTPTGIASAATPSKASSNGHAPGTAGASRIGIGKPSGASRLSLSTARSISSASGLRQPSAKPTFTEDAQEADDSPFVASPALSGPSTAASSHLSHERDAQIDDITSTNLSVSVDALKRVQRDMDKLPTELINCIDQVLEAVTIQMRLAFDGLDSNTPPSVFRLCKHLMQTLTTLFDNVGLSKAVSRSTLELLLAELTRRLLETAEHPRNEQISSLHKVLNMILIRIFHNADRTACFGGLFAVLRGATVDLRDLDPDELSERSKYAELVMKCLWKVSKTAKESLQDGSLDLAHILHAVDDFLNNISPAEWRRRASDNIPLGDMPLRTVKTILQQVVTVFGDSVLDDLERMGLAEGSFVVAYLQRLVNNSRVSETQADMGRTPSQLSLPVRSAAVSASTSPRLEPAAELQATPSKASNSDEIEVNQQLKVIFEIIGQPETSKQGIQDLYNFQKANPQAEPRIRTWIDATGKHFKSYLQRAMSNIRQEDPDAAPAASPTTSPTTANKPSSRPTASAASPTALPRARVPSGQANSEALNRLHSLFGFAQAGPGKPRNGLA